MAKKKTLKYVGFGILALLLVAFVAVMLYDSGNSGKTFAVAGRNTPLTESHGGLLSLVGGSNCYSYFGSGDCWSESETYRYGDATARASARMSVVNPFDTKQPAYYDNGVPVYVGDQTFQWACSPGDEAYIRVSPTGTLGWYTCDDYGCTGTEQSSWKGEYVVKAPATSIPKIMFQCWDYNRADTNGYWAYAWVWAGISYDKWNAKLVTSIPDTDGDGVKDDVDKCASTPAGLIVDATGCPMDSDKDGVFDGKDTCPNTIQGTPVDASGCPLDDDKDGVSNNIDKCANTPSGLAIDAEGCPLDGDKDGVFDTNDQCPDTLLGVFVDSKGCPLDTDKDGVIDVNDKCPGTLEGATVDADGCIPVVIEEPGFFAKIWLAIKGFFAGLFS